MIAGTTESGARKTAMNYTSITENFGDTGFIVPTAIPIGAAIDV